MPSHALSPFRCDPPSISLDWIVLSALVLATSLSVLSILREGAPFRAPDMITLLQATPPPGPPLCAAPLRAGAA